MGRVVADGLVDSPVVTCNINTSIADVLPMERMIVEYRRERLIGEEVQALTEFGLERSG